MVQALFLLLLKVDSSVFLSYGTKLSLTFFSPQIFPWFGGHHGLYFIYLRAPATP